MYPTRVDWDPEKASSNFLKHGVAFAEAGTVFHDKLLVEIHDPLHSDDEDRWVAIGMSSAARLLVVVYTVRSGHVRVITARRATKKERLDYEERRR